MALRGGVLPSFVIQLLAMLALASQPPQATLVELPVTSARYENLQNEALRFFRAVRNGDKPTLVRLSPDGAQERVRRDLDNPTSPMTRMLLTGSRAMRGRFMSVQSPRLTFFRERAATEGDERVVVCFSDPRQEFKKPARTTDLPVADSNRAEMCLPFVFAGKQWLVVLGTQ
jgi:hypothetical protein